MTPAATSTVEPTLTVHGAPLGTKDVPVGTLRATSPDSDIAAVRAAVETDGYAYLPGFFDRQQVLDVRGELTTRLSELGALAPGTDPMEAVAAQDYTYLGSTDANRKLAGGNAPLQNLLYGQQLMTFWESFLGGTPLHFDFTWVRATPSGPGTPAHTDIVFMGRGTKQLYTAWVPYGDVPRELGGLAVLEGGHRHDMIRNEYGTLDADTYCEDTAEELTPGTGHHRTVLSDDPAQLQQALGGRWLTTDYAAGDIVIFGMYLPHVGLDNHTTDRLRLSSDSRYQLADEDVDPRWIGANPIGHGIDAKVGMIC